MAKHVRNSALALALVLELIAIALTISADKSKRIFTLNTISQIVSKAYTLSFSIQNYFYLKTENQELIKANKALLTQKFNCKPRYDTIFSLIEANVIKNSVNRSNNLIIISAGSQQGIKPDDGVISASGNVVGTVISVGKNYSSVLSILNKITSLSVLHKKTNALGELSWNDVSTPRLMNLNGIPTYLKISVGDTIITSGYSQIFPKGILVGTVYSVEKSPESNSYNIKVLIAEDMSRLQHVFVIKNKDKKQILNLIRKAQKILTIE